MEKFVEQTLLYDFYGELLTEHQKAIYEEAVFEDMGYSEIASEHNISRQGVFDLVRRCDKILAGYEEKLHLVNKFIKTQGDVKRMRELATRLKSAHDESIIDEMIGIADDILANS